MKKRVVILAIFLTTNIFAMLQPEDSMSSFSGTHSQPSSRSNSSTSLLRLAKEKENRCCCAFMNRIIESFAHMAPTPINPPLYVNTSEEKTLRSH